MNGDSGDVRQLGILEAFKSKLSQLCSAAEAAEMVSIVKGEVIIGFFVFFD